MMIINDLFQFWRLYTNKPLKEKRLLQDLILKKPLFPDIRNNNMSNTCSLCNSTYVWPADLKGCREKEVFLILDLAIIFFLSGVHLYITSRTEKDHL
jgi:hypothetical protein